VAERKSNERGSVSILALVVTVLLIALAGIAAAYSNTELKSAGKHREQTCAYYVAEAGLDLAIREMNRLIGTGLAPEEIPPAVSKRDAPFHNGSYSVRVKERLNEFGENAGYTVLSKGRCGGEEKVVGALLKQLPWDGPPEPAPHALRFAVYAERNLSLRTLSGLLGLSLMDRTIVANGNITGLLEVGGVDLVRTELNLIAKKDIRFLGAVTGLQVGGVLFAEGDIAIDGHAEVTGYTGARNIDIGGGILSGLLGLLTGSMHFGHELEYAGNFPPGAGFRTERFLVVERKELDKAAWDKGAW